MINTSAVILTGETSKDFSNDKGTLLIDNKVLIRHIFDIVNPLVDEVVVVVNTQEHVDLYANFLPKTTKFIINAQQNQNPLSGAIAGFETAQGKYTVLLSYDAPFINEKLLQFLMDLSIGKTAAIPRNADDEIKPLCAVYQTKAVLETAKLLVAEDATDMQTLIKQLRGVRYILMSVIEQIDPELRSFFRVNTPLDFKRAERMLQGKQTQHKKQQKKSRY